MLKISKKYYKKNSGGAILLQVLLGLGLMLFMTPIILDQIKKYNEEIKREEIIADLEKLQKAVSSFVVFEKDKSTIPLGVTWWKSPDSINITEGGITEKSLVPALKEYFDSNNGSSSFYNGFGQAYSFLTYRPNNSIENEVQSVVLASCKTPKCIDTLTLNGIGQFLFDKGSVISKEKILLGELKVDPNLQAVIDKIIDATGSGVLIMYVSDAFFTSDFLHATRMPGDRTKSILFNTMQVDLDMGGHDIKNVYNLEANQLNVLNGSSIKSLSSKNVTSNVGKLGDRSLFEITGFMEYRNNKKIEVPNTFSGSSKLLPISSKQNGQMSFDSVDIGGDTILNSIDNETLNVEIKKSSNIPNYKIRGSVDITGKGTARQIVADTTNIGGNVTFETIIQNDNDKSSYIYVSCLDSNGKLTLCNSNDTEKYAVINLKGVSSFYDIILRTKDKINLPGGKKDYVTKSVTDLFLKKIECMYCIYSKVYGSEVYPGFYTKCKRNNACRN